MNFDEIGNLKLVRKMFGVANYITKILDFTVCSCHVTYVF